MCKEWALIVLVAVSGCAAYHPLPMTFEAVHAELSTADMNALRLQAGAFKHPLLKSVPFDDRDGLSPDEAAILAVVANPTLRAVRDRRGIASAQLLQAGILPNPRLTYKFGIPVAVSTQDGVNSFGLGLTWNIAALLSRGARLDAAKAHASSVDLVVAWQEWQVAEAARLHAYCLIFAEQKLTAAKKAKSFFQRLWKQVKRAVALGIKTQLDLAAAWASRQEARVKALNAQATLEQERLAFKRALGLPAEKMIPLEKNIVPRLQQCPSARTLFEDVEHKRLDLLALKLGYESQEARVRSAVRSQFPKIRMGLTGGRGSEGIETIGVAMRIDLPFFDRNQGHIAAERASRQQLFDQYAARLFETRADIDRLVTAIAASRQRITAIDQSLSAQKTVAEKCRRAALAGQIDVFFCYQTVGNLYNRQIERIKLQQQMIEFGIALEIAAGRYGLVGETGRWAQTHERTTVVKMSQ